MNASKSTPSRNYSKNLAEHELLLCIMGNDSVARTEAFDELKRREANANAVADMLSHGDGDIPTQSVPTTRPPRQKPTKRELVKRWTKKELLRLQEQWREFPKLKGSMIHHPWSLLNSLIAVRDLSNNVRRIDHSVFYVGATEAYLEFLIDMGERANSEVKQQPASVSANSADETAVLQTTEGPIGEISSPYAVGAVARDPSHVKWLRKRWQSASELREEEFGVWCMRRVWRQEFEPTATVLGMTDNAVREMSKRIPK